MDPDTFLTAVYVIVDDLCQAKSGEVRPKRRGRKPVLSESEVITLALLSQWHGRGSERAFLRFAARHWRSSSPCSARVASTSACAPCAAASPSWPWRWAGRSAA